MNRPSTIDIVTVLEGLFNFAEESKWVDQAKIVNTNYRVCVVDVSIEDYFDEVLGY